MDVNREVRDYRKGGAAEVWVLDYINQELLVYTKSTIRVLRACET